jgi:hypothetical protein
MQTTTDRSEIPALTEPNLIQSNALNVSKVAGTLATGIGVIAAALGGVPAVTASTDDAVRIAIIAGIFVVLGASVIGLSWIVCSDMSARASVTNTNLALRSTRWGKPSSAAQVGQAGLFAPPLPLFVKTTGGGETYHSVIGVAADGPDDARYLISRPGDRPVWVANADVLDARVEPVDA